MRPLATTATAVSGSRRPEMDAEGSGMGRLSIAEAVCQPGGTARGWGNTEPGDLRGGFYSLGSEGRRRMDNMAKGRRWGRRESEAEGVWWARWLD